ncbi:DUF58 domain-containing protein [Paenibacillus sp. PL2-23]|uniref:DUF58 domain-containing protein n=1 Tax=Paenibacillus sp. PL2-23 TaxID=2100729 RepID=UPI0030F8C3A0
MEAKKAKRIRWRFIAFVYGCSLFYFLFQGGKTALMLFIILNLLLLYLMLGRFSGIGKVSGSRAYAAQGAAGALQAGGSVEVQLKVKIPGLFPLPYVIVRDALHRHNGQALQFETSFVPNWKRTGEMSYRTPPLARGEYRFRDIECVSYDVFGLFEHAGSFRHDGVLSVLPQTVPLRQWNGFQRGVRGPYSHAAASRSAKETTQINGVREYHYGDRLSRVHWNATAKTGQWKSKAFERESLPRTIMVLDRYAPGGDAASRERFELAVSVAASIMEHGSRDDTAIGLVSIGDQLTMLPPKSGAEQRSLVMKHLTNVEPDAPQPIYQSLQLADSVIEPGSFALLVSQDTGSQIIQGMEWLSRKGLTPCLIHISSPGGKSGSTAWKRILESRGWLIYEVRQLQELPAALEGSGIA